jgi:hypothetical protein
LLWPPVGSGANVRGDATLGILPVENGYRLVYRMKVSSDWAIRDVYVAQILARFSFDQRHTYASRRRPGQRDFRHAPEDEHEPDVVHVSGGRQAPAG